MQIEQNLTDTIWALFAIVLPSEDDTLHDKTSGSHIVLPGSKEIRDRFSTDPWKYFCNRYFEAGPSGRAI